MRCSKANAGSLALSRVAAVTSDEHALVRARLDGEISSRRVTERLSELRDEDLRRRSRVGRQIVKRDNRGENDQKQDLHQRVFRPDSFSVTALDGSSP